jgi:hypothetical protein
MKATAIILLIGALLVGAGAVTNTWLREDHPQASLHKGLLTGEECIPEIGCSSFTFMKQLRYTGGKRRGAILLGAAGGVLGANVAVLSILCGVFLLRRTPKRALTIVMVSLAGLAIACAIAFLVLVKFPPGQWAFGVYLYFLGAIACLIAGILGLRRPSPIFGRAAAS